MTEQQIQNQVQPVRAAPDAQADVPTTQEQHIDWHPDHTKATAELQRELDKRVEAVRNHRSMDTGEKTRTIGQLWNVALEQHAQLDKTYESDLHATVANAEKRLFSVPSSMRAEVRSAYNDIHGRASLAYESGDREAMRNASEELENQWERAERTSDEPLKIALGHIALERGLSGLRDSFLSQSKERGKAWEDYNTSGQQLKNWQDSQERMWRRLTGPGSLSKPPELY